MPISFLYFAHNARAHEHLKTTFEGGAIYHHLRTKPGVACCGLCKGRAFTFEGWAETRVRCLPVGRRPVFLVLHLRRVYCRDCDVISQEPRLLAEPRRSYTRAFGRLVVELSAVMPLSAVADYLGVGWDLVKSIVESDLKERLKKRSWRKVRRIAIDEIAVKKGHRYMTVVVDLDSGEVLAAVEGRDAACLEPVFRRLRLAHAKLEAVAVDLAGAYTAAVRRYWPDPVALVYDRFHVVALMNDKIDQIRRQQQRDLEDAGKAVLKGSRYLLLRGAETLAQDPEKKARLDELLSINEPLHKAYLLKEQLRLFWSQPSKASALTYIQGWIAAAYETGLRPLKTMAATVGKHIDGILASYDHPISSGPLEGLNNKIKVLKRMGYGYRNMAFFALRILFIHETKFRLSGA